MKKFITYLALAAFASLTLQAGEKSQDKAACSAKAQSSCCASQSASTCAGKSFNAANKVPMTLKGAQVLAKR